MFHVAVNLFEERWLKNSPYTWNHEQYKSCCCNHPRKVARLVPNIQILRERISSSRTRPIVRDLDDIVIVKIHPINDNHGGQFDFNPSLSLSLRRARVSEPEMQKQKEAQLTIVDQHPLKEGQTTRDPG